MIGLPRQPVVQKVSPPSRNEHCQVVQVLVSQADTLGAECWCTTALASQIPKTVLQIWERDAIEA